MIYNPRIIIDEIGYDGKKYRVIRDDHLLGGTKQRGIVEFCQNLKEFDEIVYVGPNTGHAQIALAIGAQNSGKKATIIMARTRPMTLQTQLARKLGANIMEKKYRTPLRELKVFAGEYIKDKPRTMILRLGFDDSDYCECLRNGIVTALDGQLDLNGQYNFWMVGGSGLLATILHKLFVNSFFNVVQVGKEIDQIICGERFQLYKAPEFFYDKTNDPPPWNSVLTYDAKVWQFVKKYAKGDGNDIIWNVARDPTRRDITYANKV